MSHPKLSSQKIKTYLQNNICIAVFEKADGTTREMTCTLIDQFLPQLFTKSDIPVENPKIKNKQSRSESIVVWDLDEQDWRSFRYDRLSKLKIKTGKTTVDVMKEVEL